MLVIVGSKAEVHFSKSQVGMGSESDCLLGKLRKILERSQFQWQAWEQRNSEVWLMAQVN